MAVRHRPPAPPIVQTPWGPMSESARAQAAINMLLDPAKYVAVLELLTRRMGSQDLALAKMRHDYPELFVKGV